MDFTYDGILEEIKTQLALETDWANTYYFGVYDNLLSPIAYIAYQMVYAAEFYYRESNWQTAQKRESLLTKADYLDYTPYRKIGASGNLSISGDSSFSSDYKWSNNNVSIARWTEFTNDTGTVNVYATETKVYSTNKIGNLSLSVKEGTPKSFTYFALGNSEEKIYIYSDTTDNSEITVQIIDEDGNILNDVNIMGIDVDSDKMYFLNDADNYYCEISNATDFSYVQIMFGNGINTKKLTQGERVLIKYAETSGTDGNIQNANIITKFKNQPTDVYGNDVTLYVTNDEEISDASDIETLEHIRNHAPNIFQTGYRCGGSADWIAVLENHEYITNAIVWTPWETGDYSESNINKVYITAISADGNELTSSQQDEIITDYLKDLKSPTEITEFQDLNIIYGKFVIKAEVSSAETATIDTQIKSDLDDNYGILNTDFNTNIYESKVYEILNDINNITWHNTEIYTLEKDFNYSTSTTTISVSKTALESSGTVARNQIYLSPDSFEIWVENIISGEVSTIERAGYDLSGVIREDNGYTLTGTSIDYNTNEFSFVIDTLASGVTTDDYNIHISYKTEDGNGNQKNNLRLGSFNQITDIDSNYIDITLT